MRTLAPCTDARTRTRFGVRAGGLRDTRKKDPGNGRVGWTSLRPGQVRELMVTAVAGRPISGRDTASTTSRLGGKAPNQKSDSRRYSPTLPSADVLNPERWTGAAGADARVRRSLVAVAKSRRDEHGRRPLPAAANAIALTTDRRAPAAWPDPPRPGGAGRPPAGPGPGHHPGLWGMKTSGILVGTVRQFHTSPGGLPLVQACQVRHPPARSVHRATDLDKPRRGISRSVRPGPRSAEP